MNSFFARFYQTGRKVFRETPENHRIGPSSNFVNNFFVPHRFSLLANYCVNHCVYGGFNCNNEILRKMLSLGMIRKPKQFGCGHRHFLVLTENPGKIARIIHQ
jgi:hypothetical protein